MEGTLDLTLFMQGRGGAQRAHLTCPAFPPDDTPGQPDWASPCLRKDQTSCSQFRGFSDSKFPLEIAFKQYKEPERETKLQGLVAQEIIWPHVPGRSCQFLQRAGWCRRARAGGQGRASCRAGPSTAGQEVRETHHPRAGLFRAVPHSWMRCSQVHLTFVK